MTETVHDRLVARFMVSLQHTKKDRDFARHLAHCVQADLSLGVVGVERDGTATSTGVSWRVPGVAELAVADGQESVGLALFKRQLTPDEARHLAAQLIDAAHEARVQPSRARNRAAMAQFWASRKPAQQQEPSDLLDLLEVP